MTQRHNNLKTVKEIASAIGRGRTFVQAAKAKMEAEGIAWQMNMISVESFIEWVKANDFRSTSYSRKKSA